MLRAPILGVVSEHEQGSAVSLGPRLGRTCIVGGGVAGISAARVLLSEGIDCVLFEQTGSLGGVWSSNYYGHGAQVPAALYEFPDEPLPPGCDFTPGSKLREYIERYAAKHGVTKISRMNCGVVGLSLSLDSSGPHTQWIVRAQPREGEQEVHRFDFVVLSTGVYCQLKKFIPDIVGADTFVGSQLHSVDLTDIQCASGKQVITVGYGKSAHDIAMHAAAIADKSTLLFRQTHWPCPRKILGFVPIEYATFNRLGSAILLPAYPVLGKVERVLHSIPGLLTFVWWLVSRIFAWQFRLRGDPDLVPQTSFIEDFWCGHGILPHPDFFPMVRKGNIVAKRGEIVRIKARSVELRGGEELAADVLVYATGFKQTWDFLPSELRNKVEDDGLWLYRNMIHPDFPNLCFLNSNVTTFTNITTAGIQARWLVDVVGRGQLPSTAEMHQEIARQQAWKRCSMPNAGQSRACILQTHQLHYYDELLKDMGASIRRKRGYLRALREGLEPYRPRDFATIVSGEYRVRKGEQMQGGKSQSSFVWELLEVFVQACFVIALLGLLVHRDEALKLAGY